jgi:hypothetical protein
MPCSVIWDVTDFDPRNIAHDDLAYGAARRLTGRERVPLGRLSRRAPWANQGWGGIAIHHDLPKPPGMSLAAYPVQSRPCTVARSPVG